MSRAPRSPRRSRAATSPVPLMQSGIVAGTPVARVTRPTVDDGPVVRIQARTGIGASAHCASAPISASRRVRSRSDAATAAIHPSPAANTAVSLRLTPGVRAGQVGDDQPEDAAEQRQPADAEQPVGARAPDAHRHVERRQHDPEVRDHAEDPELQPVVEDQVVRVAARADEARRQRVARRPRHAQAEAGDRVVLDLGDTLRCSVMPVAVRLGRLEARRVQRLRALEHRRGQARLARGADERERHHPRHRERHGGGQQPLEPDLAGREHDDHDHAEHGGDPERPPEREHERRQRDQPARQHPPRQPPADDLRPDHADQEQHDHPGRGRLVEGQRHALDLAPGAGRVRQRALDALVDRHRRRPDHERALDRRLGGHVHHEHGDQQEVEVDADDERDVLQARAVGPALVGADHGRRREQQQGERERVGQADVLVAALLDAAGSRKAQTEGRGCPPGTVIRWEKAGAWR